MGGDDAAGGGADPARGDDSGEVISGDGAGAGDENAAGAAGATAGEGDRGEEEMGFGGSLDDRGVDRDASSVALGSGQGRRFLCGNGWKVGAARGGGNGGRAVIKYERNEMLRLRFSDERADEKWQGIYEGLGATALELDSIFTHNDLEFFDWGKNLKPAGDDENELYENQEEVEYYSDSSDAEGLRKPALYVEGEPDFDAGPPQDGFEFLRRVRWEEARCERVKIAKVAASKLASEQTPYMPEIPPIVRCDPELLPSKSWETEFLADFSKLRAKLLSEMASRELSSQQNLPHIKDKDAWRVYCFGCGNKSSDNDNEGSSSDHDHQEEHTGQQPYLSTLINMDEVSRATLLRHHILWLEDLETLPEDRALWLYALSAVVDEPLDIDTSAAVRDLLRKCALIRASRSFRDERELQMLNIIITITGKHFGQADC